MKQTVLLTAAAEDTEHFRHEMNRLNGSLLHYPLERYKKVTNDVMIVNVFAKLAEFENIAYGCKRNARFFVDKMKELNKLNEVRERLNLALNQQTAEYLEREGIPAIHPQANGKAINVMEFMLRTRRLGNTLYPCGDKTKEDLPGFLQELDIPVKELVLFTLEGPQQQELEKFQENMATHAPAVVVFHSRRSVNRTLAAFPHLDYTEAGVIAGDRGVAERLKEKEVNVTGQAEGSWPSILAQVEEAL